MVSSSSFRAESSLPSTVTVPPVGRSRPPSMWSRVDLPEPEVPTTATNSPFSTVRSTPSRARTSVSPEPYTFRRSFVSKIVICHSSQEKVCIAFRQYRLYQRNLSTFFLKSNSFERIRNEEFWCPATPDEFQWPPPAAPQFLTPNSSFLTPAEGTERRCCPPRGGW